MLRPSIVFVENISIRTYHSCTCMWCISGCAWLQVDCADSHGNTLLSEASAGGALRVCKPLLKKGAYPNAQGEFRRTPLWRAAFLGKTDLIIPMLEGGCDPRIANESGELPVHVAASDEIRGALEEWDVRKTDELEREWKRRDEKRAVEAAARKATALRVCSREVSRYIDCKLLFSLVSSG
jgi:hypothetical protein